MKAPGTRAKKRGTKLKRGAAVQVVCLLPSAQNQSGARTAAAEEFSVLAPACCSVNNRRENTRA
jgi:hypothetical protein